MFSTQGNNLSDFVFASLVKEALLLNGVNSKRKGSVYRGEDSFL